MLIICEEELRWTHKKHLSGKQLLRRHYQIKADLAQIERNLREGEAQLPIEEQLRIKLRRFIEAEIPELTEKVRVEVRR